MRNVGPAHGSPSSPKTVPLDMSREGSREGPSSRMEQFANPVCSLPAMWICANESQRAAPPPPAKTPPPGSSHISVSGLDYTSWFALTFAQADRAAPPPPGRGFEPSKPSRMQQGQSGGTPVPPALDRSTSHRLPTSHTAKPKQLDRSHTTRAASKPSPSPSSAAMTKSHSQSGGRSRAERAEPAPPAPGSAAAALSRQHTQGKQQTAQQGTTRRRDKAKENEEVIRQLQAICSPGDPNQVYRNLQKIGQG
jgi:p21-activated kinase 1